MINCSVPAAVLFCVVLVHCTDVEEMSDSLVSQLTANVGDYNAVGDADGQSASNVVLSAAEYNSLTSRLAAAEETARHTAEQLQHALSDLEKMRLSFLLVVSTVSVRVI